MTQDKNLVIHAIAWEVSACIRLMEKIILPFLECFIAQY